MDLWQLLVIWWLVPFDVCGVYGAYEEPSCPKKCICLSVTQVLCNGGGLTQIPESIPATVEHLSLTKNNIRGLKTDAFHRFKQLRKLYLDGNNIRTIRPFAFRGLGKLQELSLQNTPLDRLSKFTFSGLHNVTNLYLANNQIRSIEKYAFAGTSSIRLLVLTNNPMLRIDSAAFSGLSDVQMIFLPAGIRYVEADAFNGLSMIGHLKLAHLDVQALDSFVFRGLKHVQLLSIQESDLGTIRKDAFTNMSNIERLSFVNNKIDAIEQLELTASNRIKSFHFVGNHLLDIPMTKDINIDGIEEKVVVNNHFPCDCRIRGFVGGSLFINQSLGDAMDSNFCISPFEVHGLSLLSASRNLSLLHNCSELTSFGVSAAETTTEIPALASLPASQNRNRPLALVIYATALFTLLKIR